MEFLVRFESVPPESTTTAEREEMRRRERARAEELRAEGSLRRLWRAPGRRAVVGLWEAPDATALHDALASLPTFAWWTDASVEALATHPQEQR